MNRIKIISIPLFAFLLLISSTVFVQAQTALKDVFKNDFLIGAALNQSQFDGRDVRALPIIKKHFNTISPENALKWESVHPKLDEYDFEAADRYVEFGEKNGMFIIGHTLIWHNQTPPEVFEDERGAPVTRAVLLKRMREHIRTVVGRYRGRIKGWDVVNEALNENGTLRPTPWLKIIGADYIAKAFEYAHEADPQAELYYNDYSVENKPKRAGAVKLIKGLLDKKIPVKAIGLQGHNNLSFPTVEEQDKTIAAFARLGVKVMITELDVSVLPDPEGFSGAEVTLNFEVREKLDPYKKGLPEEVQQKLAERYAELFGVYLKHRQDINRITFWNVTDGDSWLNNFPVRGRTNYPLLFDREGRAKPAFERIIRLAKKDLIDLTEIGHIAPKGRVQDKELNQLPVIDELLARGKDSIPFLISQLENETKIEARVLDFWYEIYVGDIALIILNNFFTKSDALSSTLPGFGWDEFLERGTDRASMSEAILRNYIEKYGRKNIKERWQKVWEENKENIYWDETERCFKVKANEK